MAKVRQLFNDVTVEVAKRQRICSHNRNGHKILKDECCLVIKNADGAGYKNYCVACGTEILHRASEDLQKLSGRLTPQSPP
jgi:hypothetical protein